MIRKILESEIEFDKAGVYICKLSEDKQYVCGYDGEHEKWNLEELNGSTRDSSDDIEDMLLDYGFREIAIQQASRLKFVDAEAFGIETNESHTYWLIDNTLFI